MASTNMAPVTYPALTVCTNLDCATGLKITSRMESSSMRIVVEIEVRARRVLHPGIGDQYPQRGQVAADGDQPGDHEMLASAEPIPAKEEQANEGAFEEKRHQSFDRERHAEDVAHVVRVVRPVRAELKLHRDAGRHAHGEIDAEQDSPEARHVTPDRATGHDVDAFHDRNENRQAEGQRHEQEVIQRRDRKLQAR